MERYGNRAIYLAPVYVQYSNLFGCNDDAETASFDPRQNDEIAEYFAEVISFAGDEDAVDIRLLGDHRIELYVSETVLFWDRFPVMTVSSGIWTMSAVRSMHLICLTGMVRLCIRQVSCGMTMR